MANAVSVADAKARCAPALVLYVTCDNRIPILCALGGLNFQGRSEVVRSAGPARPVLIQGKIRSHQISISRVIPTPTPVFGDATTVACEATTRQLFSTQSSVLGGASAGGALLWRHRGPRRPSVTIV
jgi:AsmA family protein